MCNHGCPANPDLFAPLPPRFPIQLVNDPKRKAYVDISEASPSIYVDETYARSLDADSQEALMWHESAHLQSKSCARECDGKPEGCERCADNRLGASMYLAGFDRFRAFRAVEGLRLSRDTAIDDSMAGWDAAKVAKVTPYRPLSGVSLVGSPLTPPPSGLTSGGDSGTTVSGGITLSGDDSQIVAEDAVKVSEDSQQVVIDQLGKVSCDTCQYDCGWIAAVTGATMAAMVAVIVATVKA